MPKVSQEHLEAQRLHILMSAFKCFGRKGFHETTMREICEEAEMSPGAVYNYFDGKKAIIRAIAEKSRESAGQLFDTLDQSKLAIHHLREVLMKMSAHIEQPETSEGHYIRVRLWGELLKNPDLKKLFKDNITDLISRLSELIEKAKKENSLGSDLNSEKLAQSTVAFYQGMVLQKAFDPDKDTTSIFELFMNVLEKQNP